MKVLDSANYLLIVEGVCTAGNLVRSKTIVTTLLTGQVPQIWCELQTNPILFEFDDFERTVFTGVG